MSIARNKRQQNQPKCDNPLCHNQLQLENFHFCSLKCRVESAKEHDKVFVINQIQNFVRAHERIPVKYELPSLYSRTRVAFGTWNHAIEASGYDPNPIMFAKHYVAKDGHKCDSMAETIVDDWLYTQNIEHRVHVPYPWKNGMKCDFLVRDIWIEIFGLEGNVARYDELKKQKLELIRKYKLDLIPLSLKETYSMITLYKKLKTLITK